MTIPSNSLIKIDQSRQQTLLRRIFSLHFSRPCRTYLIRATNMSAEPLTTLEQLRQSNNWDLDKFATDDLDATVQMIHLCALRNDLNEGDEAGEPPTSHWTMCLQHSPASCVMLDMAPGYGSDGRRGKVETTYVPQRRAVHRRDAAAVLVQALSPRHRRARPPHHQREGEGPVHLLPRMGRVPGSGCLSSCGTWKRTGWSRQGRPPPPWKRCTAHYWINPEGSEPRVMREGTFRGEQVPSM